jgi:hypothetical protein
MAHYGPEEWWYPDGTLAANQRIAVFGPGNDNVYAPIFSDVGMTVPLANPNVTTGTGTFEFYAPDGTYWIYTGTMGVGTGFEVTLGANPNNPVLSVNGETPDGGGNVTISAADVGAQPIATINAAGDLYIGTGNDTTTRLPIGAPGEVLTVVAGTASWEPGGGGAVDSVNGQTGVVVLDAGDVGADVAGAAAAAAAASQPLATIDAAGDLYVGTGNNTTTRLPLGAPGEVLTVSGGTASWEPAPADAVTSVNGQTGIVVLDAGDVGADPAGSAAAAQAAAEAASDPVGSAAAAQAAAEAASQALATIDALGDLYVGTGNNTTTRLPRGANGEVLATNDGEPTGLEWIPAPGGAVDSVNGQTGIVVLDADDVGAVPASASTEILYGTDEAGAEVTYTIQDVTGDTVTTFTDGRNVLTAGNGSARWINRQAQTYRIVGAWVTAGIVPTGADIIVDVNLNGTTIYTTQGNRPTVPATTNGGAISATPDVTALAPGDYITVDIDQIGSTIAGGNITVGLVVDKNL